MFDTLQERLSGIFDKITGRGVLSEKDVDAAMREVRRALIEADVALPVVRSFVEQVREKAVGQEVIRSVKPGQMVVKIVHDALVEMLGREPAPLMVDGEPPNVILMVGLQGSGKTTTSAKIARWLKEEGRKKVLLASLDTRRPAAQEQLATLAQQIGADSLPIVAGQQPVEIAERALKEGRTGGYDVVILDTAGRLHIDEELMQEVQQVRAAAAPRETLLVADALTGQDAVNLAKSFDEAVGITGIVLTRVDGDGRGGAALSMRAVTGKPIKLMGVGEKMDALEPFHPERIANRILGMGDVVSLVEKAAKTIDEEKARKIAERMKKGAFTLDDLAEQLKQMQRMGGMKSIIKMLPGMGKLGKQLANIDLDDMVLKRQLAIISSMTPRERAFPKILNASRKKRVAAGSGTTVPEVNRLIKMHKQMASMMKKMGKGGGLGRLFGLGKGKDAPTPEELERMQAELAGIDPSLLPPELRDMAEQLQQGQPSDGRQTPQPTLPGGLPGLGGLGGGLPGPGGPGGGLPGLGGLPPLKGMRGKGKKRR